MSNQITVEHSWLDGRPCFEVPVEEVEGCFRPRLPKTQGYNWSAFYSEDKKTACVAATPALVKYFEKRQYAIFVGMAQYAPNGLSLSDNYQPVARVQNDNSA